MNNNINYELPPIKKIGPAVLPKPKNIKIQAGRATINFTSDGSANRPTITITTGRGNNSPTVTNSSPNGFTYNIPIQHVGSNRNFVISTQDNSAPSLVNSGASNSYIIPVKLSNSNQSTVSKAKLPTSSENERNNFGNIFIKTNRPVQSQQQQKKEQEVDLLRDLLVKNSSVQNEQNCVGMCTKCSQKIIGAENGLKALDSIFHIKCFVCHGCGYSLQDEHFYSMENKTFCEECYNKMLEKCSFCLRPINDRILRATGKPFHPECFNCIVCKKNLDGIPFTVDASNKIHCIECFHEKYAPRCYICRLPITPESGMEETIRIVAMDKNFHIHCYKCEDCGVSLSSNSENAGGCFPLDDHIYCKNCNYHHLKYLVNAQGTGLFPTNLNNQTPRSTDL